MKLHGPIVDNLGHAVASARRLRGHAVYKETLSYWSDLLREGRIALRRTDYAEPAKLEAMILQLEEELADRSI